MFQFPTADMPGYCSAQYVICMPAYGSEIPEHIFQNDTAKIDLNVFISLASEYFFSTHPSALGNFIMGRLRFGEEAE